jgi:glutaredoxin-like protein
MKLFNEDLQKQLKEVFDNMKNSITLAVFTQEGECYTCEETKGYMEEIEAISDKIQLKFYDVDKDQALAKAYQVEMVPSTVFLNADGVYEGVKFYGIPAGHEVNSFVTAVLEVSGAGQALSEKLMERINAIDQPVSIKVFVTLSCPHCAGAVEKAHKLALLSPHIEGVMIEAETFGELSEKYNVSSVPKIVINDTYELVGNQPIEKFLEGIEKTRVMS